MKRSEGWRRRLVRSMLSLAGVVLLGTVSLLAAPPAHAAATTPRAVTSCGRIHGDSAFNWGPVWAHPSVDAPICSNGTTAWLGSWGPDCSVNPGLGATSAITWCGVANNGGSWVEPGVNYTVTYSFNGISLQCRGWYRVHVNASDPLRVTTSGGLSCF
jgi:hypothetical protein